MSRNKTGGDHEDLAKNRTGLTAMTTFAVTAPGISYFGVGAAFRRLVTGLGVAALSGITAKKEQA